MSGLCSTEERKLSAHQWRDTRKERLDLKASVLPPFPGVLSLNICWNLAINKNCIRTFRKGAMSVSPHLRKWVHKMYLKMQKGKRAALLASRL